jgi:hypothetical protein
MVEAAKSVFLILSALFPIVDPLGGSPIFLAMTREYSPTGACSRLLRPKSGSCRPCSRRPRFSRQGSGQRLPRLRG